MSAGKRKVRNLRQVGAVAANRMPWESEALAVRVGGILESLEISTIDSGVRLALQRSCYRKDYFGGDGAGHITLLIRTIVESEGNQDALVEPIVSAVEQCMRPGWTNRGLAWIEAFDQIPLMSILQTMRGLDLFSKRSLPLHLSAVLHNKLCKILEPAKPESKPAAKREPKPPRALTRVPGVERNIVLGLELLALRSTIKNNCAFGRAARRQFDVDAKHAAEVMKVARIYGARPEIFTRLSWNALLHLASPALPAAAREVLEARIRASETITAPEIRAAHGARKAGKRQTEQPVQRMAA